jgi:hypothetical protein
MSNFGFRDGRSSALAGFNAKLSEYGAAVGLAALDAWPVVRTGYVHLGQACAAALAAMEGVSVVAGSLQEKAIQDEAQRPAPNTLSLAELKRRKLRVKDQIFLVKARIRGHERRSRA